MCLILKENFRDALYLLKNLEYMDKELYEIAKMTSLIKRMNTHMSIKEAQHCINEEYDNLIDTNHGDESSTCNDNSGNDNPNDSDSFDISSIPIEELKRQYIDYNLIIGLCSEDNPLRFIKEDKEDGTSRPLGEVQNAMLDKYHFHEWQFRIEQGKNNVEICMVIPQIGNNIQMVTTDMDFFGYFCSYKIEVEFENLVYLKMKFEPIFQDDVSKIIREYEFLYHATPSSNVSQILEQGIKPLSDNHLFSYPPRVFLMKGDVTIEGQNLIAQTLFRFSGREENELEYTILTLDVDSIPQNIPFYYDPNHEHGVFTNSAISPSCIVGQRNVIVKKRNHL